MEHNPKESLYRSADASLSERSGYDGHVAESSLYTKASLHPIAAGAVLVAGLGGAYVLGKYLVDLRREHGPPPV